jgi:hypothetical protein
LAFFEISVPANLAKSPGFVGDSGMTRSKPHRFGKQKRLSDSPRRQLGAVLSGSVYFQ